MGWWGYSSSWRPIIRVAHFTVLTGFKLTPRKDLVASKLYFLMDAFCAAAAYSLHWTPYFYPILILQQWQHIFYYSTWDESKAAKRVISWSSLDWDRSRWNQLDLVAGTLYDNAVHAANVYFLGRLLPWYGIGLAMLVVLALYYRRFLSNRTAWASRSSIPDWVAKRMKPLTPDQIQEVPWMDQLSGHSSSKENESRGT